MLPPHRLILVRHGESVWNAEELLQGQLDPPLSERGRKQALALGPILEAVPPDRVLCSDLSRATETAALLGLRPRLDPRWREIDVGEWAGRPAAEIDAQGSELTNWRGGPRAGRAAAPGAAVGARGTGARAELVAAGGPWLVVCHGGCIRVSVAHVTGADPLRLGSPPNASATVLELTARPRLLVYGSVPDGAMPTGLY